MNWRFWQQWTERTTLGKIVSPPVPSIEDGLTYSLPILAPRQMMEGMTPAAKTQFLKESAAQTFRFQFDTPQRTTDDLPFMPPTEDPLCEWPITTREYVLEQTHAAVSRNPIAKRAVRYSSAFTIGEGFNLVCTHPEIEAELQAFIEHPDNQIRAYERHVVDDLLTDGELFLRLFVGNAAQDEEPVVVAVPQRPWECRYIDTDPGYFRRVRFYHFEYRMANGDNPQQAHETKPFDVPAEFMIHVAINKHNYELRGRPDIYAALPWLRSHKEWLENRARQNHWRSSFLWAVQVKNATAQTISAVASRWARPPSPGSISIESDTVSVQPLVNPVNAGDSSEDGRQLKLMSAVAFGLPEYMLSDGANANLASSTSQQLPALTTFGDLQYILVEMLWTPLLKFVLAQAIKAGRLKAQYPEHDSDGEPADGEEMIDTLCGFTVSYRPVANEDISSVSNAFHLAVMDEACSLETYATRLGLDWSIEKKRIANERQQVADEIASGLRPPPIGVGAPDAVSNEPNTPPPAEDVTDAEETPAA